MVGLQLVEFQSNDLTCPDDEANTNTNQSAGGPPSKVNESRSLVELEHMWVSVSAMSPSTWISSRLIQDQSFNLWTSIPKMFNRVNYFIRLFFRSLSLLNI